MNRRSFLRSVLIPFFFFSAAFCLTISLLWLLWAFVPKAAVRYGILALCAGFFLLAGLWVLLQRRQTVRFADELCQTLDAILSGHQPQTDHIYDDSLVSRVQGKLLQCCDVLEEGRARSQADKETIQGLVSDISHQVKTPIANIRMFTDILRRHSLSDSQRERFLATLSEQTDKLDFLLQSLIKMSRLETGTFVLHPAEALLEDTIARAMSTVWAEADAKGIRLSADCPSGLRIRHDPKWTAIARALIMRPAILLADEPTGNLDSRNGQNVLGLLKLSVESWKQTLLLITHNLELAQMADRVVRMEDGRIRSSLPKEDLSCLQTTI